MAKLLGAIVTICFGVLTYQMGQHLTEATVMVIAIMTGVLMALAFSALVLLAVIFIMRKFESVDRAHERDNGQRPGHQIAQNPVVIILPERQLTEEASNR